MARKAKFKIAPHMRLHEWVAEEKGYFQDEGLDYEFIKELVAPDGTVHDLGDKVGAYQTFEKGRESDVCSACHWTVNAAASAGHGKLYAKAYSVANCGIFVAANSPVKKPEDLANVPVSVGYQSGSHYSTIQALEQFMPAADIKLSFSDGLLFHRLGKLVDGEIPAVSLFSGAYYVAEQLGYRKICDTSFMMAGMVQPGSDMHDVEKFYRALRRAQADIDLRPELYVKYYLNELPERFHASIDVRSFGPGERIVFEPYSRDIYERSQQWISEREIFPEGALVQSGYHDAVFQ
ncbi:hypothetical protein MNBD_ALPHA05-2288 [hydrothermal vent metagenome]|uniref:ABC transporter substrate-binding protein n=1 Tax=hydrothermal vent metagenome TaxID=652676 RepID=A0A3B0SWU2_9ZZZZ